MNVPQLIWLEILYRKLSFAQALAVLVVAVAVSVSTVLVVRSHQLKAEAHVAQLNDEIRKITKNMGFNIDILPKEVNLSDLYANDFGEATMPFDLVKRLADSREIVTINHLRPSLIRKVRWREHDRDVILMGVSAVVPWTHRKNPKKPLEPAVPEGKIIVGAVLAEQLNLKAGQEVVFRGEKLILEKVYPSRGSSDDITVWIDLAKAQEMLQLPGRINMIQALECNCASIDRLGEVRAEIAGVLGGDVQVIERSSIALARAEAREKVKAQGAASLDQMQQHATKQTVLLAVAVSAIIGLLMFINARQRRYEIGILRAIGASTRQIILLFVGKGLLLGFTGAILGCLAGFAMGLRATANLAAESQIQLSAGDLFVPELVAVVMVATIFLTALASWIPAVTAATQDPAVVLSQE
ncbi:MAG: FtsX-like permease family protein [Planctomycetes bacterium]|nr:FtsX-like permease family protein [Planctomycetota bacterium]